MSVTIGLFRLAVAVAAAASLASALPAGEPAACPAIDPPPATQPRAGLRAFRDPETGELRAPTPGESAALARAEAETAPAEEPIFEVIVHPDGMKTVDLRGAFAASIVVTRNPDGSLTLRCVSAGPRAGDAAPARPSPAQPALEEK
ncbi:MAG: post-PEP-CTERM-1 domain-containing protein [Thermoanaerobaculia bacterium]